MSKILLFLASFGFTFSDGTVPKASSGFSSARLKKRYKIYILLICQMLEKANQWYSLWLLEFLFVCLVIVLCKLALFFLWLYHIRISSHIVLESNLFSTIHIIIIFHFLAHKFMFYSNIVLEAFYKIKSSTFIPKPTGTYKCKTHDNV